MFELDDVTVLEEMSADECYRVLGTQSLGRVGLVMAGQPLVLPVNYALIGKTIVFRTARGSGFDRVVRGSDVVFEIDHADPAFHSGWSVMGRGRADGIDETVDLTGLTHAVMRPWARESPPGWIGIPLNHVTGRRINHLHRRHP
jgi:nitroimidazol reductase NimA-like FMN-containing flavoprotein (pyridoxamine 5'-phosphate oxidase superfamily)